MITIKKGVVTIEGVRASNYKAGAPFAQVFDDSDTEINIDMRIVHHIMAVMAYDTKTKNLKTLLKNNSLWNRPEKRDE